MTKIICSHRIYVTKKVWHIFLPDALQGTFQRKIQSLKSFHWSQRSFKKACGQTQRELHDHFGVSKHLLGGLISSDSLKFLLLRNKVCLGKHCGLLYNADFCSCVFLRCIARTFFSHLFGERSALDAADQSALYSQHVTTRPLPLFFC